MWTFLRINKLYKIPPISLSSFKKIISYSNDEHNGVPNGNTDVHYLYHDKVVGYMTYRPHNGQIGIIRIDKEYRGRTLGQQMLDDILPEIKAPELWAVTTQGHPFWTRAFNGQMRWRKPVHESVTGAGYYISLSNIDIQNPGVAESALGVTVPQLTQLAGI